MTERTRVTAGEAHEIAKQEIIIFASALELRLASAMTKALDTVKSEFDTRLQELEEEHARVLRHLGLEDSDE